ncbi:5-formyltetrahydrofolate cyclo-ligase [Haloarcula sp. KBTZ06]|uniref:5-formyltetrahydrofolate cyclo-ligase n=1 Tax=Haloarcula sp. KBTZ06 TaxID=3402682 RepID=UPI003B4294F6
MEKQELREQVWDELEESGDARFPFPPHGRIPNFAGAKQAAERLTKTDSWKDADVIKSNPDSPQRAVRRRALEAGKVVYMAVPRLQDEKCFLRLDPHKIDDIDHATTIGGSSELGEQVGPEEMEPVDLIVSGSVAMTENGGRVGKGEGYSDLEFAILREVGLVDDETTTVTTVHEIQVVDEEIPTTAQDVPIDWLFTPERSVRTEETDGKPAGIEWAVLSEQRLDDIPILGRLEPT